MAARTGAVPRSIRQRERCTSSPRSCRHFSESLCRAPAEAVVEGAVEDAAGAEAVVAVDLLREHHRALRRKLPALSQLRRRLPTRMFLLRLTYPHQPPLPLQDVALPVRGP